MYSIPKKLRQAYNVYCRTVKYNPEHLQAGLCYANFCRVLIREDEDVEQLYAKSEEICALDLEKELELAVHYLYTQQLEKALATCQRALLLTSQDSRIDHLFASIYFEMKDFEQATQYFEKTIALTGGSVRLYHELATLKIKQEKWSEATEALKLALDCSLDQDQQASLLQQLGVLLMKQEDYGQALQFFYQASALLPDDTDLLYALITVQQKMMDYQAAITLLESRVLPKVGLTDKAARFLLANLYLMAQQPQEAAEILGTLLAGEPKNADYHVSLAQAHLELGQKLEAEKSLKRALRHNPHHATARSLYDNLKKEKKQYEIEVEKKKTSEYFDSLDLSEFFDQLGIEAAVSKLSNYLLHRYWKNRDPRGAKPTVKYRPLIWMSLVMGLKDWNFNFLYSRICSQKEAAADLRKVLELPEDVSQLKVYTTYKRQLNKLGRYPFKFLMNWLVRQAASSGYIDLSNILLDSSLIPASSDLARFFPDSPTTFSEKEAGWSYPKPWTGRVFGFKLHLATATDGEPIDADVVPANPNDITLGKQAIRRLGRLFAPLNLKIEFVIADSGYCSNPLRELISEILGAAALFHFNPRRQAQKQNQYSYLDDKEEWIKAKRQLRSRIERTFAQLKLHFGLNNLRIRGLTQVAQYILSRCIAYIACVIVAHRVGRPDLKASPKRLLWSC
ncbi:MAG: transposase [Ardenticatenaceae bacterium]